MFTGLIEAIGQLRSVAKLGGDVRMWIAGSALDCTDVKIGDSICVNGVCLTVVLLEANAFALDVSNETLACTTLGTWREGRRVNLEKALRLSDRLGGHLVSGHVDGIATVLAIDADARSSRWRFTLPVHLARYVAVKGSIAVDGVSLTVNAVDAHSFSVNLIPHTLANSVFGATTVNDPVNLEIDLMARYAERMIAG
ncbi:MAG: riboflavin synthase [Pseudomonadota bacterium]|nr:riboflavin synthase [Pseudomonadota bacterium]